MDTFKDYINSDFLKWLQDYNFKYKQAAIRTEKGVLDILFNDSFCLKIYDRLGHGFGVTINVADKYDESVYSNDIFSLYWAFEYFKIKQTASFSSRTQIQYEQNLPHLISDIKNIIPRLAQLTSFEWTNMIEWIAIESKRRFT
jgi:hypothetical protein